MVVAAYVIQSSDLVRIVCLSEVNFYILYFITLTNAILKLPEDVAETPKHAGAICNIIIFFNIYVHMCIFIQINK